MTFYERVKGLCNQHGTSITALVTELGFSGSAATTWKASKTLPRPGTIKKVADYFAITIDELKKGVTEPIDYENINTDEFNQDIWLKILKENEYNEEKAIKAYLDFEKAQAQDASSDTDRPALYQNNGDNYGVIGEANAPIKISNSLDRTLSTNELEILRIFSELSIVQQAKVLVYAAEIRDGK